MIGAHRAEGIPIVEIHMDRLDAGEYGQLLYFLETTCAISAMLSGINPLTSRGGELQGRNAQTSRLNAREMGVTAELC